MIGRRPTRIGAFAGLAALTMTLALPAAAVQRPLWELGLGVGSLRLPHYRGSDQSSAWLLPVPYIAYRGEIFKADRDGARAVLLDSQRFDVDVSASASTPTRSRDNHAREGMPDLKPTIELGPNVNWTLGRGRGAVAGIAEWKLDLRLPLRAALSIESQPRVVGWIATPNVNLDLRTAGGWNVGLLAGPVIGDRKLHGYFYDVAPAHATAGRPAYRARGGYAGATALAGLSRRDGPRWIGFFVKVDSLRGAAFEDSPLVRQRSQWSAGLAMSWVLTGSSRSVDVDE
ncbi:MipA/OmpV family protein [Aquincola sp. S2]|uniref:MipA/OmpV family protein n=1 Tax=Pseudaquabacterium terrae TaxID=2732868 RepID=A0ABX2EJ65_9BURK|nr:MipA/OmpV family protein [Aquabacterium terrae]NRF68687.1 MipA/OmpV family protein [Aquabacterium terrae]